MIKLLDVLAQEYLFLDCKDIDIPTAGKLLNHLENISNESRKIEVPQLNSCATGLSQILEKVILDAIPDKTKAADLLEEGIRLMQQIADSFKNTGKFEGDIQEFMDKLAAIIPGLTIESDVPAQSAECTESNESKNAEENEESFQIQDESLLRDFIAEGLEYIEEIEVNILNLENEPENKDYINTIFRPFHSIKGVASFLNLEKIRDLAHSLENLLDKARNDEISVTPTLIDVVLDGADVLKTLIGGLREILEGKMFDDGVVDIPSLKVRIEKIEQGFDRESGPKKIGEILIDEGVISKEDLEKTLKANEATPERKLGQALIEEGVVKPKQLSQALRKQADQITDMTTIRVDTTKLDDLIDMVGELVITQSMIQQDLNNQVNPDKQLVRDISQFFRITSTLQQVSTTLRMIPIKQTFQRMSRLVRDLAKSTGKLVSVELIGEDTEIDRNMVDEIYNPLVHMIRNSVDHGLESPEERIKLGKTEKGLIQLKAYHRGGNIVIEITDDGRGLDKNKILQKALKNGIIQSEEGLTDQEIYKFIFLPGLSTAEKITDVSGRGVGMDVVRQAVERLRGKIEIESSLGVGTTFITRFPLTLAIIDGMIVKVGAESYILPTISIRQALRPSSDSYTNVVGKGEMINAMSRLMPMLRLYEIFDIEPIHKEPWDGIVVVVDSESGSKCLLVDEIVGKAEVVVKSLGEGLKSIKGVAGGAILGDGRIGLIIDIEGLFELSEGRC